MKSNMKPSCVRLLLLIPIVANFSLASIETETKYTIITSPSKTPLSTKEHLDALTTGITEESTPVTNIEDAVSISVLNNGKTMTFIRYLNPANYVFFVYLISIMLLKTNVFKNIAQQISNISILILEANTPCMNYPM